YIEQMHATFFTDHKPNVDIATMNGLNTSSTARARFRLQTWAIFVSQYRDRLTVVYRKGGDMEVPDALSRMRRNVSARRAELEAYAEKIRGDSIMTDTEVDPGLLGVEDSASPD